jgi:hypothetical protein
MYHRHLALHKTKFTQENPIALEASLKMIKALEDYMGAYFGRRMERVFREVSGTHKI